MDIVFIIMVVFVAFIIAIFFFTRPSKKKIDYHIQKDCDNKIEKFSNLAVDGIQKGLNAPKRTSSKKNKNPPSQSSNFQSGSSQPIQADPFYPINPMYMMGDTPSKSHDTPNPSSSHDIGSHHTSHHSSHDYSSPASDSSSSHGSHHSCSTPSSCSSPSSCSGGSSCGGGGGD